MRRIRRISPEARAFYGSKACRRRPVLARVSDEDDSDQIETLENVTESSRQLLKDMAELAEEYAKQALLAEEWLRLLAEENEEKE